MEFVVWDLKVEEGITATKWVQPYDDQMLNTATGSYSWQFSPSNGIKMWNGEQIDDKMVFKVDGNGVYVKGNGEFTGTITANSGKIGGWTIDQDALYSNVGSSVTGMCSVHDDTYCTEGLVIENGVVTGYTGTDTVVHIPKVYNGVAVTSIGDEVFYFNANITSVTIPNSVTSIGHRAFGRCTYLTSCNLPVSLVSIGDSAF
jgi:hypothetical protein